jgi:hypothetical protein
MDERGTFCAISNFVKFGGVRTLLHHKEMLASTLSFFVSSNLLENVTLPLPSPNGDTSLYNVENVLGYIILWPYKLIVSKV